MNSLKLTILLGAILSGIIAFAHADVIKGRLLDSHNMPIKNADVMAVTFGDTLAHPKYYTLHADAAGRFQVEMRSEYRGVYGRLYAVAPGMAPIGIYLGSNSAQKENVLHLRPAATVSGRVIDSAGKAVSNAIVQLAGVGYGDDSSIVLFTNTPWEKLFQTVTDKNGRWELTGAPKDVTALIIVNDPRFVIANIHTTAGSAQPTTTVRPGAILTGRVVTEDDKPAAGISIFAERQDDIHRIISAKTTADGSYRLTGLSNGTYNITVDVPDGSKVARPIEGQIAREGKTTKLPDIKLMSGGIIKGEVRNKKTGQPISGIQIIVHNMENPRNRTLIIGSLTDDKGRYSIRVVPGENQVNLMGASSYFQGKDFSKIFDAKADQAITHNVVLKPFETIHGTVVDEKGNPVKDVSIVVTPVPSHNETDYGMLAMSDAHGNWNATRLSDGEKTVHAVDPWRNLETITVTVPHIEAIHLTVQNINALPPTGRVVDINNNPLKNIQLRLQYQFPISGTDRKPGEYQDVTSDNNGELRFTVPEKTRVIVVNGIMPTRYVYVRGGEWDAKTQHLSDIVLDKLDNVVRGKVLGADGKPVAGARVQAAGFGEIITHTNNAGSFELRGLPHQHFTVLASSGKSVAKSSGGSLTLHLKPIHHNLPSRKQALDMLERLWRETTDKEFPGRIDIIPAIAKYDSQRALDLLRGNIGTIPASQISGVIFAIEHMTEADAQRVLNEVKGKVSDQDIYSAIDKLAKAYPALALQWAGQHLKDITDESDKVKVLSKLAKLAARQEDALAQKYFSQAVAIAKTFPAPANKTYSSDESSDTTMGRFLYSRIYLAAASAKVYPDQTHSWVLQILPYSVDPHRGSRGDYDEVRDILTRELVAAGATTEMQYLIAQSTSNLQYMELGSAVQTAADANKVDVAQKYLDQLLQMYEGKIATKPNSSITPEYIISAAIGAMIDAVGETDPARALKLARLATGKSELGEMLALAGQYQPKTTKLKVYEEAYSLLEEQGQGMTLLPRLAGMIYDLDAARGKVLIDELLRMRGNMEQMIVTYGYLETSGAIAPLTKRKLITGWLILQNAWAHDLRSPESHSGDPKILTVAMSQVDFNQAMQWARNIPGKQWGTRKLDPSRKHDAQLAILKDVLNPKSQLTYLDLN